MKVTKKKTTTEISVKEGNHELNLVVCHDSGDLDDFDVNGDVPYLLNDLCTVNMESLLDADPDDFDLLVEMLKVAREEFIKNRESK